jgi:hypothetical protein
MRPSHVLTGERSDSTSAPSRHACTEQRAEETGNGILKTAAHHPNSGVDQTAETDDCARIDCERLERPHERPRSREIHRPLCVGNTRES